MMRFNTAFFLFFAIFSLLFAQRKVKIKNSDILKQIVSIPGAKQLIGNVLFAQQNTTLSCDSSIFYDDEDIVYAFGDVHIISDDTNHLYADEVVFYGEKRLMKARKNVILQNPSATLYTDSLDYDLNEDVGWYEHNGRIEADSARLTSLKGWYYSETGMAKFRTNVKVYKNDYTLVSDTLDFDQVNNIVTFQGPSEIFNDTNYLYAKKGWADIDKKLFRVYHDAFLSTKGYSANADTIFLDNSLKQSELFSSATIRDSSQNLKLKGHYLFLDKKNQYSYAVDSALAIFEGEDDTLYLHADTLIAKEKDSVKWFYGINQVKFFRGDLQGAANTFTFNTEDSITILKGDAVIWSDSTQVTGDIMRFFSKNGALDSLSVPENPFVVNKDTVYGYFNQIKGETLSGNIKDNLLTKLYFSTSGNTLHFMVDETDNFVGLNKVESADIKILFKEGEFNRFVFIGSPVGTIYPPKDITRDLIQLRGFSWRNADRPYSWQEVFKPNVGEGTN